MLTISVLIDLFPRKEPVSREDLSAWFPVYKSFSHCNCSQNVYVYQPWGGEPINVSLSSMLNRGYPIIYILWLIVLKSTKKVFYCWLAHLIIWELLMCIEKHKPYWDSSFWVPGLCFYPWIWLLTEIHRVHDPSNSLIWHISLLTR